MPKWRKHFKTDERRIKTKMEKDKFIKWREKYIRNSKPLDFGLDMKDLNKIGLIRNTDKTNISKGVRFASLTKEEYDIFDNWNKKEQIQFLEDYFNYYMVMMD